MQEEQFRSLDELTQAWHADEWREIVRVMSLVEGDDFAESVPEKLEMKSTPAAGGGFDGDVPLRRQRDLRP